MAALNGRGGPGARNPVQEMELQPLELPDHERPAAIEGLNARLATLTRALGPEAAQVLHTAYLAGWKDAWWHGLVEAAGATRAELDLDTDVVLVAPGQIGVRVVSRVPELPETIGRQA